MNKKFIYRLFALFAVVITVGALLLDVVKQLNDEVLVEVACIDSSNTSGDTDTSDEQTSYKTLEALVPFHVSFSKLNFLFSIHTFPDFSVEKTFITHIPRYINQYLIILLTTSICVNAP